MPRRKRTVCSPPIIAVHLTVRHKSRLQSRLCDNQVIPVIPRGQHLELASRAMSIDVLKHERPRLSRNLGLPRREVMSAALQAA